jgi:hypothetical protein
MLRRSLYALIGAVAAVLVMALGAPLASGAPGPGAEGTIRLDGPIFNCATGDVVGRARFRDDFDGRQRLELRADAPDAAGGTFTVRGFDFEGPGLPGDVTLDDQGKARIETRIGPDDAERFEVTGDNPNIDVFAGDQLVASTDPTCSHVVTTG